jgi:elongation factor Tu
MFRLTVEDVFVIRNRGGVATGRVESGVQRVGDNIGVLFTSVGNGQLDRGSVLSVAGEFPPIEKTGFVVSGSVHGRCDR